MSASSTVKDVDVSKKLGLKSIPLKFGLGAVSVAIILFMILKSAFHGTKGSRCFHRIYCYAILIIVYLYKRAIAEPTPHAIVNDTLFDAVVHFNTPVYDAPVVCPFVIPPSFDVK